MWMYDVSGCTSITVCMRVSKIISACLLCVLISDFCTLVMASIPLYHNCLLFERFLVYCIDLGVTLTLSYRMTYDGAARRGHSPDVDKSWRLSYHAKQHLCFLGFASLQRSTLFCLQDGNVISSSEAQQASESYPRGHRTRRLVKSLCRNTTVPQHIR
jgi:hypothetical protein